MAYVTKRIAPESYSETIEPDENYQTIQVMESEKEAFTGLYDHEGTSIFKTNDFKMGFI